jgi:Raf kinase inhibitor-like YbhB/YbcL family protein
MEIACSRRSFSTPAFHFKYSTPEPEARNAAALRSFLSRLQPGAMPNVPGTARPIRHFPKAPQSMETAMAFTLESPAFRNGARIPEKYARKGQNLSPPLGWRGAPPGTKSFALIVEDPDAPSGTFYHWALYDIPPGQSQLPEGAPPDRFGHGINDFGDPDYDGPQPPKGHGPHHYRFRLLALDVDRLDIGKKAPIRELLARVRPHALGEADLVGIYETP